MTYKKEPWAPMEKIDTAYSLISSQLEIFIRKFYLNLIIKGIIWFLAILFALFLLTSVTAYFAYLSVLARSLIFYLSLMLIASLFWQYIGRYLLSFLKLRKRIDHKTASRLIGEHFPDISDKLLNTIELHELAITDTANTALITAGIKQKALALSPFSFAGAVDFKSNLHYIRYILIPLIAIILLLLIAPVILRVGASMMLNHSRPYLKPAPFSFIITNKDLAVIQGSSFVLTVKTMGTVNPSEIFIIDKGSSLPMEKIRKNLFRYSFANLQSSQTLFFRASDISSPAFTISVLPKPELVTFSVRLDYPYYLHRPSENLANSGDLVVPEGTIATWTCKTSNASAILFSYGTKSSYLPDNISHIIRIKRTLDQSGRYTLRPVNQHKIQADTLGYSIQVIRDQVPDIAVTRNEDSLNLTTARFTGRIHDDFGISSLRFIYGYATKTGALSQIISNTELPVDQSLPAQSFFYKWTPTIKNVNDGAKLGAYFEVRDNDLIHGRKASRTGLFYLIYPSKDSLSQEKRNNDRDVLAQLKHVQNQAAQLQNEANRLHDKIATQKELNYEDRKEAERIVAEQNQLEQNLAELQKLSEKSKSDTETRPENTLLKEKEKQIADLFKSLIDPKTQDMLAKLQKLLRDQNKNKTGESLENIQTETKNLEKELDRMKALYKKMAFEQSLEQLADKVKDLSAKESKISSLNKLDIKAVTSAQKEVRKDFNKVTDALQDLQKEKPADAAFSNPEEQEKKTGQSLKKVADQLAANKQGAAAKSAKDASTDLKELSDQLTQMQEQDAMQELGKDLGSIRMILQNLLRVSFAEESLMQKLKVININDPQYNSLVQTQFDLKEDLNLIRDSVFSLSKRVPQIQSFVNRELASINSNLESAIQNLGDRQLFDAATKQQFIMTAVNNLAVLLSNTEAQMAKAMAGAKSKPGGKKKGSGSADLSQLQEGLNKDMQQKLGNSRNNPGNMSQELAQMAARQQAIREAFERLNKQGGTPNKSLNQALKKMDETETDLLNRRLDNNLLARQKEIMTRLLEADQAGREQKQENKREAKQGQSLAPADVAELNKVLTEKKREEELIKTILPDLNSFYKTRINSYFKTLNEGN